MSVTPTLTTLEFVVRWNRGIFPNKIQEFIIFDNKIILRYLTNVVVLCYNETDNRIKHNVKNKMFYAKFVWVSYLKPNLAM